MQKANEEEAGRGDVKPGLGIIIPVQNAGEKFSHNLNRLNEGQSLFDLDLVVVDGGSEDETVFQAQDLRARILETEPDLAMQVAAGLDIAFGDWLMVLDGRVELQTGWSTVLRAFVDQKGSSRFVGHGGLAIRDRGKLYEDSHIMSRLRNRFSGLPYSHQGLVLHRSRLNELGGVRALRGLDRMEIAGRVGQKYLMPLPFQAINDLEGLPHSHWGKTMSRVAGWMLFALLALPPSAVADWSR